MLSSPPQVTSAYPPIPCTIKFGAGSSWQLPAPPPPPTALQPTAVSPRAIRLRWWPSAHLWLTPPHSVRSQVPEYPLPAPPVCQSPVISVFVDDPSRTLVSTPPVTYSLLCLSHHFVTPPQTSLLTAAGCAVVTSSRASFQASRSLATPSFQLIPLKP